MNDFVRITPEGRFSLGGKRWMCNSVVYFAKYPGAMRNWLADEWWARNEPKLDWDFDQMARIGINHAAMFFGSEAFFDDGKPIAQGYDRLDRVVETAKSHGLRVSIFLGPFIDTPEMYRQITGEPWTDEDRWLPSMNPSLHAAYVAQIRPFAERYRNEPAVMAYTDRIDRFHKGFDNVTIPFNLKEEWAAWLKDRYGSIDELRAAKGGVLEGDPADFHEVLLPQESPLNGSLRNPMAFDYILWQKESIGEAQAQFDAEINAIAPDQFVWTPFEGNTNTWAMLDGFSPERKKLQAIWMEYYFFENCRPSHVQPFEEWAHTREVIHRRLAHQLPVVYTAAYMMVRYLKQSVQQPVVMCHGAMMDNAAYGIEDERQQAAIYDRVNAACLAADGDGWHYWSWTDDYASKSSHPAERKANPTDFYWSGESTGLMDWDDCPRPVVSLLTQYSRQLRRIERADPPVQRSDVLMLSSAARMYNLFRRMAYPTAAAVCGALGRVGVRCDYLWTAQNDVHISDETLGQYRLIVIADNMYGRDFRDMPAKLLRYVEAGGTLYFAMDRFDTFEDPHGVAHDNAAMAKLTGVDAGGWTGWPGAGRTCRNWIFSADAAQEANMDAQCFPRLSWGICPDYRHLAPDAHRVQLLGFRSTDDDTFTPIPGLVDGAEVIAVGKFPAGSRPFFYRHGLGQGAVYVNAWTNNIFRDSESRNDYGGWDYDWMLATAVEAAGVRDVDLTGGASLWLRNVWGYFWKDM